MPTGKRQVEAVGRAVAAEIRSEVARRKLRVGDLAKLADIPQSTLSKLLAGTAVIDVDQLAKVSQALGIEVAELVSRAAQHVAAEDTFGGYLRRERLARGMTHAQVARKIGAGAAIVREWEDGVLAVPPAERTKLLQLFSDVADAR